MDKKQICIFSLTATAFVLYMLYEMTKAFVFLVLLVLVTIIETFVFFKKTIYKTKT